MSETAEALAIYRDELLRWNRRFSLLSRRDPETTFERLLAESRHGLDGLVGALGQLAPAAAALLSGAPEPPAGGASVLLVDIGSGNGMPGLPWHLDLRQRLAPGARLLTTLVEPRRKRAWFLERMAARLDPEGLRVLEGRWQDGPYPELAAGRHQAPRLWLLLLRGLHLAEADLLAGWWRQAGPGAADDQVATIRFAPPGARPGPSSAAASTPAAASNGPRTLQVPVPAAAPVLSLRVSWYPAGPPPASA